MSQDIGALTRTWNDAGEVYFASSMDVTATAYAAGSMVDRWRVNGVTVASISPTGHILVGDGTAALPGLSFTEDQNTGLARTAEDTLGLCVSGFAAVSIAADYVTLNVSLNVGGGTLSGHREAIAVKTTDFNINVANSLLTGSGNAFSNDGAVGEVIITLPEYATSVGIHYPFYVLADQYLRVKAPTGWVIRDGATVSADGGYIRNNATGSALRLRLAKTGVWVVETKSGTWTIGA